MLKAYTDLGKIYIRLGMDVEAVEILERALVKHSDYKEARETLTIARTRLQGK
jgi:hypothetical protein